VRSLFTAIQLYRSFRLLWLGTIATQLGQWMQQIALAWYMLELTDSAFWVGMIGFASGVPFLLIALPAGALIDRSDERTALMASQWGAMLVAAGLAVLILTGVAEPWHLLVAAALNGTIMSLNQMVRQTFVPALVPREHLANAVSMNSAAGNAMRIVGPAIAGVIIGLFGVAACFIVQAASVGLALLATVRIARPARDSRAGGVPGGVLDGLREVRRHHAIAGLIILTAIPAIFVFPYITLMSVFARDVWEIGAGGLGVLLAASGFGALSGALVAATMDRVRRKGLAVMAATVVYCLAVAGFAAGPIPALGMVGLFLAGFTGSIFGSLSNTLLLLLADPRLRGRIMSVYMVTNGFTPFGAIAIGYFAESLGAPTAVAFSCLLSAALVGLAATRMVELRRT
jgi:MFS family permease